MFVAPDSESSRDVGEDRRSQECMQGILNDAIGIQALLASVVILLDVVEAEVARQDEQKKCRHVACEIGGFGWACRDRRAAESRGRADGGQNEEQENKAKRSSCKVYIVRHGRTDGTCSQHMQPNLESKQARSRHQTATLNSMPTTSVPLVLPEMPCRLLAAVVPVAAATSPLPALWPLPRLCTHFSCNCGSRPGCSDSDVGRQKMRGYQTVALRSLCCSCRGCALARVSIVSAIRPIFRHAAGHGNAGALGGVY